MQKASKTLIQSAQMATNHVFNKERANLKKVKILILQPHSYCLDSAAGVTLYPAKHLVAGVTCRLRRRVMTSVGKMGLWHETVLNFF